MISSALPVKTTVWMGFVFAISTATLFSFVPYLTTVLIQEGLGPLELLLIRYSLSSVIILFATLLSKPELLRLGLKSLLFCCLCGLLYFVSAWTFTAALTFISTSIASILLSVYPLLVLLLLALRGEKLTWRNTVRLALGLAGVYLIIGPGGNVSLLGVILVFSSALSYAIYLVFMQWFLKDVPARSIALYVILTITFCLWLSWLISGSSFSAFNLEIWLPMLALVIGGTYIAQLCLFRAVSLLGSAQLALLSPLEILLILLWSVVLLDERLSLLQLLGGSLILTSMLLAVLRLKELRRLWRATARLRI